MFRICSWWGFGAKKIMLTQGPQHFSIHTLLSKACTCSIIILDFPGLYCIFFQKTGFEFPVLMDNLYPRIVHFAPSLQKQGNQNYGYLRCLASCISLDISTWPYIWQCWLIISRTSAVNSSGSIETFHWPRSTLWLSLLMMNLLLCFTGRVKLLSSNVKIILIHLIWP